MNGPQNLIEKFAVFKRIAQQRQGMPYCPFVWTIDYTNVNEDCVHFDTIKVNELTNYKGYKQPVCTHPVAANLYAQDGRKALRCIGCSGYEKNND